MESDSCSKGLSTLSAHGIKLWWFMLVMKSLQTFVTMKRNWFIPVFCFNLCHGWRSSVCNSK